MSDYQYVAFRAIDRPVSEMNLEYMRQQSSRAKITPWAFENEYHYGDFDGDAIEMLRRGYDFHLNYANYGIRTLLIRLPQDLSDSEAFRQYLSEDELKYVKDPEGPGGCLSLEPVYSPDFLKKLWNPHELIDDLVPPRAELLNGDLRPLYLFHLAVARDETHDSEETHEAPVPAGLGALSEAQLALAKFYGLRDALVAASAQESLPLPKKESESTSHHEDWIRRQPEETKNAWLNELMKDSASPLNSKIWAKYRSEYSLPSWPTSNPQRTMAQLEEIATDAVQKERERTQAKAAEQRKKRLAQMAADPTATLRETERLVSERKTDSYIQAAQLLADLREALAESNQSDLAEKQAQKLKKDNPTFRLLPGELRRQGFLPK